MPIEKDGRMMLTYEELEPIADANGIVNGTVGGLILGNSHSDGGIKVIRPYNSEGIYEVIAEFEGWEYILSPLATSEEKEYLTKINSEYSGTKKPFSEFKIPEGITILDTNPMIENIKESNKLILLNGQEQFIINKHSTKKYLIELENINKKYSR